MRVALEVAHDVVPRHVSVRVIAGVLAARELDGPVRGHEAEAVPAISPGLADASPLQDDVVDAGLGQLMADRESGVTGSDDDYIDAFRHLRPQASTGPVSSRRRGSV